VKRLIVALGLLTLCAMADGSLRVAEAQNMLGGGFFFGPRTRAVPLEAPRQQRVVRRKKTKTVKRHTSRRTNTAYRRGNSGGDSSYDNRPRGPQSGSTYCPGGYTWSTPPNSQFDYYGTKYCY
jgi:hypothetical protein